MYRSLGSSKIISVTSSRAVSPSDAADWCMDFATVAVDPMHIEDVCAIAEALVTTDEQRQRLIDIKRQRKQHATVPPDTTEDDINEEGPVNTTAFSNEVAAKSEPLTTKIGNIDETKESPKEAKKAKKEAKKRKKEEKEAKRAAKKARKEAKKQKKESKKTTAESDNASV